VASVNNNDISEKLFESALHNSDLLTYAINSIEGTIGLWLGHDYAHCYTLRTEADTRIIIIE
jgi:hypothetical protein